MMRGSSAASADHSERPVLARSTPVRASAEIRAYWRLISGTILALEFKALDFGPAGGRRANRRMLHICHGE